MCTPNTNPPRRRPPRIGADGRTPVLPGGRPFPRPLAWTGVSLNPGLRLGERRLPPRTHQPNPHQQGGFGWTHRILRKEYAMDDRTFFTLMVDLHRDGMRQGPGSDEETLHALELTRLDGAAALQVADIGCGTGASTLVLARNLPSARIMAVDLFPEFLDILAERAGGRLFRTD